MTEATPRPFDLGVADAIEGFGMTYDNENSVAYDVGLTIGELPEPWKTNIVRAVNTAPAMAEALAALVTLVAVYGGLLHDDRCLHSPNEYPGDCWRDRAHDETRAAREALAAWQSK